MIKKSALLFCGLLLFLVSCQEIYVDIYSPEKACNGTTLFADLHDGQNPRIIEVNMVGVIVWEYLIPEDLKQYTNPGLDVEWLEEDDHVLFVLPLKGVYEIDRNGNIVWQHEDDEISHDADRLQNGNTIYVFGGNDKKIDPQVKEVDAGGQIVWSWYAKDEFDVDPFRTIERGGWTHANAVARLSDGNTMVNLRNFSLTTVVSPDGSVLRNIDWASISGATTPDPHDPEVQSNGNILVALQNDSPYQGVEIDPSEAVVWTYTRAGLRTTRDCDRLPNGNTLMVGVLEGEEESVIFEVTPEGEIVWQLKLMDAPVGSGPGWFYKAERICHGD